MDRVAILLAGLPNCGKTTAAEIAAGEWADESISVGDEVRSRAAAEIEGEPSGEQIGDWLWEQYRQYGRSIFPRWMISQLKRQDVSKRTVVDGVRAPETYDVLETYFDYVSLIYISSPFEQRYERMKNRARSGEDQYGTEYLRRRDARDRSYGTTALETHEEVCHRIENVRSEEEFERRISETVGVVSRNTSYVS